MSRITPIRILRTTRANLDAQSGASGLLAGELYLITDENVVAVGLSTTTYQDVGPSAGSGWDGDIADINIDGGTDIGADLVDADLFVVDDGAGGTNRKSAISRIWTYVLGKLFPTESTVSGVSGSLSINWTTNRFWKQGEPTGAITYTFTAPATPGHLQLRVLSDGTSTAQTFTFPATVKWIGSVWTPVDNKNAVISFYYDGTNYWAIGENES